MIPQVPWTSTAGSRGTLEIIYPGDISKAKHAWRANHKAAISGDVAQGSSLQKFGRANNHIDLCLLRLCH